MNISASPVILTLEKQGTSYKMDLTGIRTEKDYDKAVKEAKKLNEKNPKPDSPEGQRLEILLMLLNKYEGSKTDKIKN